MRNKSYKDKYKLYSKRIGVSTLILLTACTNTNPQINNTNNSVAVVHSPKNDKADKPNIQEANEFNLPTMGLESQKPEVKKTIEYDNGQNSYDQKITNPKNNKTKDFEDVQSMGYGLINSTTSEEVKNWFSSQKMTSELTLGASDEGVRTLSFDLLVPLIDVDNNLVFTQVGFRRSNRFTEDYRNTINLGLGYRHMYEKALVGVNTFYDSDITGHNNRLGLGVEAWADYLKLSANSYLRLTDWKKSVDMYDYMERPANGWDLRAEAYLPQYPQLGGKLMYEQYYGDNVGLFGASNQQKDPSATTIGINYTPIPLVTLSTDYRQGQNGQKETAIKLALNFQIGTPLKKQLSPDEIRASRLLTNVKYDLVNRNNEIVMDYRKNELGTLTLPSTLNATPNSTLLIPVTFTGSIRNVTWTGTAAQYASPYGGGTSASVQIPAYNPTGVNTYSLQAIGSDEYGHLVQSNITQIVVTANQLTMLTSQPTTLANGTDFILFTANLKQYSGTAVQNADVVWTIQGNADILEQETKTDSNGIARLKISSKFANLVKVSVKEQGGADITSDVTFTADGSTAKVMSVNATQSTLIADGVSFTTLTALIHDENGNIVPENTPITWSTTSGQLSAVSSVTDMNGIATITFKTITAGIATITANAAKGSGTVSITATPNTSTAKVVSITTTTPIAVANSPTPVTITSTIHDASGNIVPANTPVAWSTTLGTLSSALTYTDVNGVASVTISSTSIGNATVTATATQGSLPLSISFTVDNTTLKAINITPSVNTALADNTDIITFSVDVQDAYGNKAPLNTLVTWSSSLGTLSSPSSLTDVNGHAVISLKSNVAGSATVNAFSGVGSATTNVNFTVSSTSFVSAVNSLSPTVVANNTPVTLQATVLDSNNQPVSGATVNWTTTLGNLSSSTSVTNASGIAEVSLSGTVAGSATVSASSDVGGVQSASVQLQADITTAKIYSTSASSVNLVADGETSVNLYAQLADANGNPLGAGITVNWTSPPNSTFDVNDYIQNISSQTDSSGIATIPLYLYEIGSYNIIANYNGISKNIMINAIPQNVIVSNEAFHDPINESSTANIVFQLDKLVFGPGYIAYIECVSGYLCEDINGNSIFPNQIIIQNTQQLTINIPAIGKTGILKFKIKINDGASFISDEYEVSPEPN